MIKHNELASRLNKRLYKDTNVNEEDIAPIIIEDLSEIEPLLNIVEPMPAPSLLQKVKIIDYIEFVFNVVCFGFASQFLLGIHWPILGTLAVGYSINFIFNKILFLFSS